MQIRWLDASEARFADYARLFPELGVNDPLPQPADWLANMGPDLVFLELDGAVVGYAYAQALASSGYVRHVVIGPQARGKGLGRELMHELRRRLAARGCRSWQLNVKLDNVPALALYRSLGMEPDFRTWVLRVPTPTGLALPPSPPLRASEPPASADATLEREFDIPAGLLARHRAKPSTRLFLFERDGAPVALAPFDPHFPGCFPFRLREASCARAVLEKLLTFVPPDRSYLQLVLERDEPSAHLLVSSGAFLVFEIQHLQGPLDASGIG
jgi:GNAT superfamily N-acetyltransferase